MARLIRAITKTVAAVLRKERQRIADDAQVLLDIREEMGIGQDANLEDVLKRNQKDEPGW